MTKTESLELVDSAITDCEHECKTLDQLSANAVTSQETIKRLENDIFDLHCNAANLEQKTRGARLTNATSLLSLERADLATFNSQIDAQSDRIAQVGQRASSLLAQVHAALLQSRKSGIEAMLETTFSLQFLRPHVSALCSDAFSVREITEIGHALFQYRFLPRDRDIAIDDARKLRTRSEALLRMAEDEAGLELNIVNVELRPVPKATPASIVNQHGTLVASAT